jgi:hypothetical protein
MSSLNRYQKNYYSQSGEDGIIEKIFKVIGIKKGWCVEFGVWDGIYLSNTYHLVKDKKWNSVLIEANQKRYNQLVNNLRGTNSICINSFIEASGKNSLDNILSKTPIPVDFDLLSIDIDGNDYHIWKNLSKYKPKLVIIEFNPTIPLEVEYIQKYNPRVGQGSSLASLNRLAKINGYELVAVTNTNAFFLRSKFFPLLRIVENSPSSIWANREKTITYFFQFFDGTIAIRGNRHLLWHGIDIEDKNVQILPKIFRHFPPSWFDIVASLVYLGNWQQIRKILQKKWIK